MDDLNILDGLFDKSMGGLGGSYGSSYPVEEVHEFSAGEMYIECELTSIAFR